MYIRVLIVIFVLSISEVSYSTSAEYEKFKSLNLMYRLTEVCHQARKGMAVKYMTLAQFQEAKASYRRQVEKIGLSPAQQTNIEKAVKQSDELIMMSSIIRSGNAAEINKDCGWYRSAIILSEFGF